MRFLGLSVGQSEGSVGTRDASGMQCNTQVEPKSLPRNDASKSLGTARAPASARFDALNATTMVIRSIS